MVIGGIPFYLSQIDPKLSAAQNIDRLSFMESGILRAEFDNLYHSLFVTDARQYKNSVLTTEFNSPNTL